MSIIQIPEDLSIMRQDFGVKNFDLTSEGGDTGSVQTSVLGPPRFTCSIVSNDREEEDAAAAWRVLMLALRGRINHLAVYDIARPHPRGSARGVWITAGGGAGVNSLAISIGADQAGATLLAGDYIGVNQASVGRQLLHVQADAIANAGGVMIVTFEPVLRLAVAAGSAVVWDRPTCLMKRTTSETSWSQHGGELQGGFSLDLMEAWQ
ncbi:MULTISPECIES: hypothetical protein [unclassified Variovorax]|uniref:hypothetical protein n=1 Tax=unclassified Variovorax TaxID=663243 RepID=UPI0025778B5F|nr:MULTISPECIES: hypothetical protein [unclassified Variovorax]MDM0086749.1 hypothetical protein [Variovorax sp. J22G40]MDM0144995.1 hypothetical protein [Variovorax sp. J2P1-31]